MTITDIRNLYVGYNEEEDFRILIGANDENEADTLAEYYRQDSKLKGEFKISEFNDINTHFDCDYIIV